MVRTQLLLDEKQHRTLQRLSRERGISISAVVREILDASLAAGTAQVAGMAGLLTDSPMVAQEHDRYLYGPETGTRRPTRKGGK